jgi:ABC-2 type transport system ATP-binding protein
VSGEAATAAVRAESLTRRFGDFVAVSDISFEIERGEIWGFLGPNGAGKSTAIRMLCGVLSPTSGRAEVLGYDVARDPEAVKLRIGYMSQGSNLWNDLTVEEHLRFYAGMFDLYGRAQDEAVEEWLERVGLGPRRDELAGSLPGGFRKRLALACTLLHRPKALFLDEPTAGVDPLSRREFWDLIVGFADEGTTVMVSTHYMDEAEHCNQLALIYGGRIIARGSPEALKRSASVGKTVEIRSGSSVAMLDATDALPYVLSASLYGSSLHVTLRDGADVERLGKALAERGFTVEQSSEITPSLEDVFASLVRSA